MTRGRSLVALSLGPMLAIVAFVGSGCGPEAGPDSGSPSGYAPAAPGAGAGDLSGSCAVSSSCSEWSSYPDSAQAACAATGGSYSAAPCSDTGRVGRCTVVGRMGEGALYMMTTSYYAGSATMLADGCKSTNGSWTAG